MGTPVIKHPAALVKAAVFLLWLMLIGLLLKRDVFISTINPRESAAIEQAEREDYQGIYFKGQKIGYVADIYRPQKDRTVSIEQRAQMTLNVMGQRNPVDLHLKAMLDENGRLKNFTFSFHSPFYRMNAVGQATGRTVSFTLFTGSATIHNSLELTAPPLLSTSRRAYLLKKGMEKGEKFKIPWFDPVSLNGEDTIIEYYGKERTYIRGRVYNLHHFVEMFAGARVNSWLDDSGEVIKEESPAGFVFVKEPKFKAMSGSGKGPELLAAVSAKLVGEMPSLKGRTRMQYHLIFPDPGSFQVNSGRQSYADGLLTVKLESLADFTGKGKAIDQSDTADLAPTASIQSTAPAIRKLASELAGGKSDDLAKVKTLADYVYNHLEKRPVLGFPDALTVLKSGRGDCNEHAVLFAALVRAAGIPCRMVAGVVFFKGAFYYHAWDEVRISGKWLSVDTTTDQLPADLSHIKFVEGGVREQMRIGALLGQLAIEPIQESGDRGQDKKDKG
jgi:Transglutaminase-like superfamily